MQPTTALHRLAMEEAVREYEMAALVSGEVEEYLAGRGIESETARTFRLGLVDDPLPGHGYYRGKLVIPFLHPTGYPLTVRFRRFAGDEGPKYLSMSDDPSRMFNVGAILRAGEEIHLTEGEFDAMILEQLGHPAVAVAGAQAWKPHYRTLLAGFTRVFIWGDGDDAGADLVNRVSRAVIRARGVRVPKGSDVTDVFLSEGAEGIAALIEAAR